MSKKENKKKNVTQNGENVPSEFGWIPPEKQKENANKMNRMTKKRK